MDKQFCGRVFPRIVMDYNTISQNWKGLKKKKKKKKKGITLKTPPLLQK